MTKEEIDKAADKLLADVDPEKMRRFMEAHPVEVDDTAWWSKPAENEPEVRAVRRESWQEGASPDVKVESFEEHAIDYVRKFFGAASGAQGFSDDEFKLAKDQSLAYMESPAALSVIKKFIDGYVALGGEHEQGDAFRSLIDDMAADIANIRTRHINYHHELRLETLAKALAFGTALEFKPKFKGIPKQKALIIYYATPLTSVRKRMLAGLLSWLMGYGAFAKWLKSDSVAKWREAYILAFEEIGGPDAGGDQISKPFSKKGIDELMKLIKEAYGTMFADGAFADTANKFWGVQK